MTVFFRKRPFCLCCLLFIFGSIAAYHLPTGWKIAAAAAGAAVFAVCAFSAAILKPASPSETRSRLILASLLAFSVLLASAASIVYYDIYCARVSELIGLENEFTAAVTSVRYEKEYGTLCEVRVEKAGGRHMRFSAYYQTDFDSPLYPGERIVFTAEAVENEEAEDDFDSASYNASRGLLITLRSDSAAAELERGDFFMLLNSGISERIHRIFTEEAAGFLSAVVIGDRSSLPAAVKRDFRRDGLSHTLAVSGLHLTIVMGILSAALKKLKAGKRVQTTVMIAASLFYMCLTGMTGSVTRAALMMVLTQLSYFVGRRSDAPTSLCASVALIMLVSPASAADVGLLLSASSTFGLLTIGRAFDKHLSGRREKRHAIDYLTADLCSTLSATVSALIFTLPVMWVYFGEISVISPLSNLLFSFPLELILTLTPVVLLLSPFYRIAKLASLPVDGLTRLSLAVLAKLAKIPHSTVSLRYPFVPVIGAAAAIAVLLLAILRHDRLLRNVCAVMGVSVAVYAALTAAAIWNTSNNCALLYTDADGSDLVFASGRQLVVCDITACSSSARYALEHYIGHAFYTGEIDDYVVTHYHNRSAGYLNRLLDACIVRRVWLPYPDDADRTRAAGAEYAARSAGCEVIYYTRGDELAFDGLGVTVSPGRRIRRSAEQITAVKFEYGGQSALYIGSDAAGEDFTAEAAPDAAYVIWGAHGPSVKVLPYYPIAGRMVCADGDIAAMAGAVYPADKVAVLSSGRLYDRFVFGGTENAGF